MSNLSFKNVSLKPLPGGDWEIIEATPLPVQTTPQTPPPAKPVSRGGRPKGIPKTKKTFYLATDLAVFNQIKLDLAGNARVLVKDESETIDFALELLATLAADSGKIEYLQNFNKKRTSKF